MQWWTVRQLRSGSAETRRRAAWKLGNGRRRGALPALAAVLLEDGDWSVRRAAAEALGQIGDAAAVEPLVQALKDSDWSVRSAAAVALSNVGDPTSVDALLEALAAPDEFIRSATVIALARIGSARAMKALVRALMDESPEVVNQALSVLQALGWVPQTRTEKALYAVAKHNWRTAVDAGATAVDALTVAYRRSYKKGGGGWVVGLEVVKTIGEIGDPRGVPALVGALRATEDTVATAAALALAQTSDARTAAPPLLDALSRRGPQVKAAAIAALSSIARVTVEPFVQLLLNSTAQRVELVEILIELVAATEDGRALPVLLQCALDDPRVSARAVAALDQIRERTGAPLEPDDARALAALKATLVHSQPAYRAPAT